MDGNMVIVAVKGEFSIMGNILYINSYLTDTIRELDISNFCTKNSKSKVVLYIKKLDRMRFVLVHFPSITEKNYCYQLVGRENNLTNTPDLERKARCLGFELNVFQDLILSQLMEVQKC